MELTRNQTAAAKTLIPAIAITDGELLMRFARHGDQAAFTTLVEKHGRLVWAVCWQVLREHHEIEDAFQSTFFILAKRARSIRSSDSLCGWLYRVAYRTALRARMASKPKPLSELVADELSSLDDKFKAIEQHEQRAVLMEELHTLPEQYQQPLILCYLEGKNRRTIADELGCSLETIKGRLSRGRQVLRHRLIRRGISLSIAMGAMSLPIKTATAAVTPKLVGLTVTGAAAWAAGAAAVAKLTTTTISSQVIHLAHQGTVAMTVASFAKPVVLGVALLGAVSASLAVDSAGDGGKGTPQAQVVDLTAANAVKISANINGDDEAAVEVTVGEEVVGEKGAQKKRVEERRISKDLTEVIADREHVIFGRQPAPVRTTQSVEVRAPLPPPVPSANVVYPTRQPVPYYAPAYPVVQPLDIQFGAPNVEANLKLRTHEAKVAELQLMSKELEIQSFDAKGEEREALLEESRKKMLMAEAEELRMQVERQKEEIKQLEKAVKEQAEGIKKQAVEQAKQAAKHAVTYSAIAAKDAEAAAKSQAAAITLAFKEAQAAATSEFASAGREAQAAKWKVESRNFQLANTLPSGALSLQPGDRVYIRAKGVDPEEGIDDIYTVEPMGTLALGVNYGRVHVMGMSVIDAEQAVLAHLKQQFDSPKLQITYYGPSEEPAQSQPFGNSPFSSSNSQ